MAITEQDIQQAKTHIPLALKAALAQTGAAVCVQRVELSHVEGKTAIDLPQMYRENHTRKAQYQLGILLHYYLGKEFAFVTTEDGKKFELLPTLDECDKWAHVLNQIERMKGTVQRDKVFDLLADYKETVRMVNSEIYSFLGIKNDPTSRLLGTLLRALNKLAEDLGESKEALADFARQAGNLQ